MGPGLLAVFRYVFYSSATPRIRKVFEWRQRTTVYFLRNIYKYFERCSLVCSPESVLPNVEAILWVQFLFLDLFQSSSVVSTLNLFPAFSSMTGRSSNPRESNYFKDDFKEREFLNVCFSIKNISATKLPPLSSLPLFVIVSWVKRISHRLLE